MNHEPVAKPVVLYDADCGFCKWTLDKLLRWDRRSVLRPVAIQSEEGQRLLAPVPETSRLDSWHLVLPAGEIRSAAAAAAPLAELLPGGRPLAAAFRRFPRATDRAYRFVANHRGRFARLLGITAILAAAMLAGCGDDEPPPPQTVPASEREDAARSAPNIVVVMTDDQTVGSFTPEVMPYTHRLFSERGLIASDAIASPPLCCPARAGFLTGQYAHNHGVTTNDPGYQQLDDPDNTLPVWLQRAGYRTALIGKYLGNYELVGGARPAPGWDRWFSIMGYAGYEGFEVSDDGARVRPEGYATTALSEQAAEFIADAAGPGEPPFFLWLAYNAPHTVAEGSPPPCDVAAPQPETAADYEPFADAPLPRPASFDEDDVADKGRWVSRRPPLDRERIAEMTTRWRCTLASLQSVDRGVETVIDALERSGELDDTLVVYLSDNGYFFGEHRIPEDKRLPYEPSLKIPIAFLPPAGDRPADPGLISNADLAPTFLDYAGAEPCADAAAEDCRELDGTSLRAALEGSAPPPTDRAIPISLTESFSYDAVRTPRYLYMELRADRDGPLERPSAELYDLRADPEQLDNLIAVDREGSAALRERLARRLDSLVGDN